MPARIAHPEVDIFGMLAAVQGDEAVGVDVFVEDRDILRGLKNLEWKRHVVGAGDAGQEALAYGVRSRPGLEVLLLLRGGFGGVGDFAAYNDSDATRHPGAG